MTPLEALRLAMGELQECITLHEARCRTDKGHEHTVYRRLVRAQQTISDAHDAALQPAQEQEVERLKAELAAAQETHADAMADAEPSCTYDLIRQRDAAEQRIKALEAALRQSSDTLCAYCRTTGEDEPQAACENEPTCQEWINQKYGALLPAQQPVAPGMTDLMVPPETLDAYLADNPLPEPAPAAETQEPTCTCTFRLAGLSDDQHQYQCAVEIARKPAPAPSSVREEERINDHAFRSCGEQHNALRPNACHHPGCGKPAAAHAEPAAKGGQE